MIATWAANCLMLCFAAIVTSRRKTMPAFCISLSHSCTHSHIRTLVHSCLVSLTATFIDVHLRSHLISAHEQQSTPIYITVSAASNHFNSIAIHLIKLVAYVSINDQVKNKFRGLKCCTAILTCKLKFNLLNLAYCQKRAS